MILVPIQVRLTEPAVLTSPDGDDNIVNTLDFIPGSMILGAWVARNLQNVDAYLGGDFSFGCLYPMAAVDGDVVDLQPTVPTPLSYHALKRGAVCVRNAAVTEIDAEMEPVQARYVFENGKVMLVSPRREQHIHLERDRAAGTATADGGNVFRYQSINELEVFSGYIACTKDFRAGLLKNGPSDMRIGKSRGSEYGGHGVVSIGSPVQAESAKGRYLILRSPMIARRSNGTADGSLVALLETLGISSDNVEKSFVRAITIGGFLSISGLPRDRMRAVDQGSVLVLKEPITLTAEQLWLGCGLRTEEGFGRLALNEKWEKEYDLVLEENRAQLLLRSAADTEQPNQASEAMQANLRTARIQKSLERSIDRVARLQAMGAELYLNKNQLSELLAAAQESVEKFKEVVQKNLTRSATHSQYAATKINGKSIENWTATFVDALETWVPPPNSRWKNAWKPQGSAQNFLKAVIRQMQKRGGKSG